MGIGIRKKESVNKKIPKEVKNENSLFVILGISEISKNRKMSLPGVIKDIANLKRIFLSENIGFSENNILTFLNVEKEKIIASLNKKIKSRDWDNIILYYTGFGATNENREFYITCNNSESSDLKTIITAKEIGSLFQEVISNIILIFDCCNAQGVFKHLYNKDVFLLGAASETGYARDTSEGGLFTNKLVEVLMKGNDNKKEFLSLNDLYLELRKKLIDVQEPEMLTTNIVQHQLLLKNQFQLVQQKVEKEIKLKSKNQIEKIISGNKLKEAFRQLNLLVQNNDEQLRNKLLLFENRFSRIRDEIILGLISRDKSNIENNQIVYGLLNLMKEI